MAVILNLRMKYISKIESKTGDLKTIYLTPRDIRQLKDWIKNSYKNVTCPFKKRFINEAYCKPTCRKIFPCMTTKICPCTYYNEEDVITVANKLVVIYKKRNIRSKVKLLFKSFFNGGFHV